MSEVDITKRMILLDQYFAEDKKLNENIAKLNELIRITENALDEVKKSKNIMDELIINGEAIDKGKISSVYSDYKKIISDAQTLIEICNNRREKIVKERAQIIGN